MTLTRKAGAAERGGEALPPAARGAALRSLRRVPVDLMCCSDDVSLPDGRMSSATRQSYRPGVGSRALRPKPSRENARLRRPAHGTAGALGINE